MKPWFRNALMSGLMLLTSTMSADDRVRLMDPMSLAGSGNGWGVEPRQGLMSMVLPVGSVSGPMPIPVTFRLNGAYQQVSKNHQGTIPQDDENGHIYYITVMMKDTLMRPVYGTIHFGGVTANATYGAYTEPSTYTLEDGNQFLATDLVPFTNYNSTFTLSPDFGLSSKAPANVKIHVGGTIAVYTATLNELGSWKTTIQNNMPTGFGTAPTQFTVVMDKDRARIYVYLAPLNVSVPLLWVDRFGHAVKFRWTRKTSSMPTGVTAINAVEATNHLSKGVQMQWAEFPASTTTVQDLARITFIGVNAPAMLVQGYPSTSENWPAGDNYTMGEYEFFYRVSPYNQGPAGRPTQIKVGASSDVGNPFWINAGLTLPTMPNDGTSTAQMLTWNWIYDANLASISSFTDAMGVQTNFGYTVNEAMFDTTHVFGVAQAISTDSGNAKTLSRSWTWGTATDGHNNVILKQTFGDLGSCSRRTEIVFANSGTHLGNGAITKQILWDGSTALSTITNDLGTQGFSPSYSAANQTLVERNGEPSQTQVVTRTGEEGLETSTIETRQQGVKASTVEYSYETHREKLEAQRVTKVVVTRFDLSTGNALTPVATSNVIYDAKGLPSSTYQSATDTNNNPFVFGKTMSYDTEGRVTGSQPYNVTNPPCKTIQSWQSAAWTLASATTQFFNPGDAAGTLSGSLNQAINTLDSADRPTSATDARGVSTTTSYDLFGRIVSSQTQGSGLVEYTYAIDRANCRSMTTVKRTIGQNAQGQATKVVATSICNGFGQTIEQGNPDGTKQVMSYGTFGALESTRVVASNGTLQSPSSTSFDGLGRPINSVSPGGASQTLAYATSADGKFAITTRNQTISDGATSKTVVTQEYRDAFGQVVKTVAPDNSTTSVVYDGLGNALNVTLTPADGSTPQVRSFQYDLLGRMISKTEPETGTITFGDFNVFGKPTTITEASGRKRTITIDGLGRTRQVSSSAGSETLSYTFTGADLTTASTVSDGGTITQTYVYNGPGKSLSKETTTQGTISSVIQYGFDTYGNLSTLTYPSGRVVAYVYDSLGRITGINANGSPVVSSISFNEWGQRSRMNFASGAYSAWSVKDMGVHLDQWTIGYSNTPFAGGTRSYTYDTGERLTKAGEWSSLVHDTKGQLTQANFTAVNAGDSSYNSFHGYDVYGNAISHTTAGNVPSSMINFDLNPMVDDKVQPLAKSGATTGWSYNLNGEAFKVGVNQGSTQVLNLGWDGLGRLAGVTAPSATQYYAYAPSGMRVSLRDTTNTGRSRKYAYTSDGMLLSEHTSTGVWKRDVIYLGSQAVAEIDAAGTHELHNDHLGTPRIVTKRSTGQIEGRQAYGPYGEKMVNTSADNTYVPLTGYTGHIQTDATGLIYMRGRFYTPAWHRFVNSDQGVDPNQWNQMAYVGGSPFHAKDPSGMMMASMDWWDFMLGGGIAYLGTEVVPGATVTITGQDPGPISYASIPGDDIIMQMMWTMRYLLAFVGGGGGSSANGAQLQSKPQTPQKEKDCREQAALAVIRYGEWGRVSNSDYYGIYGGGTFSDTSDHPNIAVTKWGRTSTAAGAYQIIYSSWSEYVDRTGAHDFSPASQDGWALWTIGRKKGALAAIDSGNVSGFVNKLNGIWQSLPGGAQQRKGYNMAAAEGKFNEYFKACMSGK